MSYPIHPKGEEVCRMLMEMQPTKVICNELGVGGAVVRNQMRRLGLLRVSLTLEERIRIADARGIDRRCLP
jgi:DNA-binding CsgD family transcriptional regulator